MSKETPDNKNYRSILLPRIQQSVCQIRDKGRLKLPAEYVKIFKDNRLDTLYLVQIHNAGEPIHIKVIPHPDGLNGLTELTPADKDLLSEREIPTPIDNYGRINLSNLGIKNTAVTLVRKQHYFEIRPEDYDPLKTPIPPETKERLAAGLAGMKIPVIESIGKIIPLNPQPIPNETTDEPEEKPIPQNNQQPIT